MSTISQQEILQHAHSMVVEYCLLNGDSHNNLINAITQDIYPTNSTELETSSQFHLNIKNCTCSTQMHKQQIHIIHFAQIKWISTILKRPSKMLPTSHHLILFLNNIHFPNLNIHLTQTIVEEFIVQCMMSTDPQNTDEWEHNLTQYCMPYDFCPDYRQLRQLTGKSKSSKEFREFLLAHSWQSFTNKLKQWCTSVVNKLQLTPSDALLHQLTHHEENISNAEATEDSAQLHVTNDIQSNHHSMPPLEMDSQMDFDHEATLQDDYEEKMHELHDTTPGKTSQMLGILDTQPTLKNSGCSFGINHTQTTHVRRKRKYHEMEKSSDEPCTTHNVKRHKYTSMNTGWPQWMKKGIEATVELDGELLFCTIRKVLTQCILIKITDEDAPDKFKGQQIRIKRGQNITIERVQDICDLTADNNMDGNDAWVKNNDKEEANDDEVMSPQKQVPQLLTNRPLRAGGIYDLFENTSDKQNTNAKSVATTTTRIKDDIGGRGRFNPAFEAVEDEMNGEEEEEEEKNKNKKRKKIPWTEEEIQTLIDGYTKYKKYENAARGKKGIWAKINGDPTFGNVLMANNRENANLCDKWRHLIQKKDERIQHLLDKKSPPKKKRTKRRKCSK
eukprot:133412_1